MILIGLLRILFCTIPLNAQDTLFHSNGVVKEIFTVNKYGVKEGPIKYFDEQGRLRRTGFFETGEMVGQWKSYHSNGQLEEVCQYELFSFHNSRKVGQNILYYENGQLYQILNYKNGKLHGVWKWFNQNGQLHFIEYNKDGETVGKRKEWYDNGKLYSIEKYTRKGEARGKWKKYYENGKLKMKGRWRKDFEVGTWKYFYESGELKRTLCQLTGKETCYDIRRHKINCSELDWHGW